MEIDNMTINLNVNKKHKKIAKNFAKSLHMLCESISEFEFIKSIKVYKNENNEVELDIEQYEEGDV